MTGHTFVSWQTRVIGTAFAGDSGESFAFGSDGSDVRGRETRETRERCLHFDRVVGSDRDHRDTGGLASSSIGRQ